ncbi:MerR family transcriptional regulator [Streptomyces zaomyceticus]|uniref:MerR family transcriptional regulator n=1 Tax=Streptomyces zaomyceticus TaxID=68286 RepID=A0ABZ1L685_9ACTN
MSIGVLAGHFGLATHVLRHWETMGLLDPARDTANRRRYRTADLTRVAVILRAKEAGLPLDTIRALLTTAGAERRRNILNQEAEALRSRIAAARAALALVECVLGCEHEDFTRCAHFRLVANPPGSRPSRTVPPPGRLP